MVIGRIERCAVATVEREGINYRIEMKVPGTRVVHVLRMPTAKEMQDHERASTSVVAARRSIETRAFLEPSGASTISCTSRTTAMLEPCRSFTSRRLCPRSSRNWPSRPTKTRIAAPGDWPGEPGVRFLIRSVLHQVGCVVPTKNAPTVSSAAGSAVTQPKRSWMAAQPVARIGRPSMSAMVPAVRRTSSKRRWTRRTALSSGDASAL